MMDASARQVPVQGFAEGSQRVLLVFEPDGLLRWSLTSFFMGDYQVAPTGSPETVEAMLGARCFDAAILADEAVDGPADGWENRIRGSSPHARIVRTSTRADRGRTFHPLTTMLEKPFELRRLADWLVRRETMG